MRRIHDRRLAGLALASFWSALGKRALQGFAWVNVSAKMPTWQRRHSRRACFSDQGGGGQRGGAAGTPWWLRRSCHLTQLASQQCTQMPQTGAERPFWPICVHSCVPAPVRNGATAQQCTQTPQNGAERPDPPICVHCCDPKATNNPSPRPNSVHECPKTARRGHFGQSVYTPASVALAVRPTSPGW